MTGGPPEPPTPAEPDDQRWATYDPKGAQPEPPPPSKMPPPVTHVPYGSPTSDVGMSTFSTTSMTTANVGSAFRAARWIGLLVTIGVVAGVGFGIKAIVDSVDDTIDDFNSAIDGSAQQPETPDVLSPDGYDDLVEAVRRQTGSTKIFEAVLYPDYASVDVPEDGTTQRERTFFWNGELRDNDLTGKADQQRIDLEDFDVEVLVRLSMKVRALVDDPNAYYVILQGKSTIFPDDGTRIMAYAANEYNEGAYIAADETGKIIRKTEY